MSTETAPLPDAADVTHTAPVSLPRILTLGIVVRVFIDTSVQIFGPFLSVVAAGLGTSIVVLGGLNSLRSLMGLTAPAFGSMAERIGYRKTMRLTLLLGAAGMFIFGASVNLWMAAVGISVMGLGIFAFAPILQGYMSAQIPYARRARGLGIVEYAWALAGIFGLFISGLLISRFGWRAPFFFLGAGLLGSFFIFAVFPATPRVPRPAPAEGAVTPNWRARFRAFLTLDSNARSAWGAITAGALGVFATANITIIYGSWLADSYGIDSGWIGTVALIMGVGDMIAITVVTLWSDRFGKYRSVLVGTGGAALIYLLLPLLKAYIGTAIIGLALARMTFEGSMVSNISLLSEQVPTQRAHVLSLFSAAVTLGVAAASATGPYFYSRWGITGAALLSAVAAILATVVLLSRVSENAQEAPPLENEVNL